MADSGEVGILAVTAARDKHLAPLRYGGHVTIQRFEEAVGAIRATTR
ncbi:hypothetical protein [Gordonia sp. CPCC 205333]